MVIELSLLVSIHPALALLCPQERPEREDELQGVFLSFNFVFVSIDLASQLEPARCVCHSEESRLR